MTAWLVVVAELHSLETRHCIIRRYEWLSAYSRRGEGTIAV